MIAKPDQSLPALFETLFRFLSDRIQADALGLRR